MHIKKVIVIRKKTIQLLFTAQTFNHAQDKNKPNDTLQIFPNLLVNVRLVSTVE